MAPPLSNAAQVMLKALCWQEELNDFERERAEHIARNRARMQELQLPYLANAIAPQPKKPSTAPRGLKARKKEVLASAFILA